jgi:hypothetical protein
MFNDSKSVFQQRIKDTVKSNEKVKKLLEDIIELHLFKKAEKNPELLVLVELYDCLGPQKFADVISIMSGRTISFPTKDDFKDTVYLAISYYLKTYENKNWEEIKTILGEKDLHSIKLGIHIRQFQEFIDYLSRRGDAMDPVFIKPEEPKNE